MTGFQAAIEKLDINERQLEALIKHWYLAGFLDEEKLRHGLTNYLHLKENEIGRIITIITSCSPATRPETIEERRLSDFNSAQAVATLFPERTQAGTALALIELLQQNHFTKAERKEVSAASETKYTTCHELAIQALADQFGMLGEKPLSQPVDLALVIGGRAKTIPLYLQDLKKAMELGYVKRAFILLSTRPLITGTAKENTDNSTTPSERLFFEGAPSYQEYLKMKYPGEPLIEGLSMRDSFSRIFETETPPENIHFISNTPHAVVFYAKALQQAYTAHWLKDKGAVSVFSIQPYLPNYKAQVATCLAENENLRDLDITVSANGRSGNDSGKILAQALAMPINTRYLAAAHALSAEIPDIQITPLEMLQLATRDKALYKANMQKLIQEKYLRVNGLSQATKNMLLEQLYWVQLSKQFTPQADVLYKNDGKWQQHLHREIFRALSRIECMLLLREVNDENFSANFAEFTADQTNTDKLTEKSFRELSKQFSPEYFSEEQVNTHIRASLIAAVTLSPQAKERADAKLGKNKHTVDSVIFSGETLGDIYPAYESAAKSVQNKLRACFPKDSRHWRHAFFLENSGCLNALITQIKECALENKSRLKTNVLEWVNYWMINALGFNGHTGNLQGAAFVTESVFQRASILNTIITQLLDNPEINAFQEYSTACLNSLKIKLINPSIAILVVRTLNMANCFNSEDAQALITHIRTHKLLELAKFHNDVFMSGKVVTYLPGFLQNVYAAAAPENKFSALLSALNWASQVIESNDANKITSFRLIGKDTVNQLLAGNCEVTSFEINTDGEVASVKMAEANYEPTKLTS